MTEQDRIELHKECLDLFTDTACKEKYEMVKGIEAVVEYVLKKVDKLPTHRVSNRFCLCKEPDERWDSGQTCFCDKCEKLVDAC
jgi:hypothetical protein